MCQRLLIQGKKVLLVDLNRGNKFDGYDSFVRKECIKPGKVCDITQEGSRRCCV